MTKLIYRWRNGKYVKALFSESWCERVVADVKTLTSLGISGRVAVSLGAVVLVYET